jgi:DNA/RNA endonuclease YhcR with UshA esterase domain
LFDEIWEKWEIDVLDLPADLTLIELTGSGIYNLAYGGDELTLKKPGAVGETVDEISWGSNKKYFEINTVAKGHSLERRLLGVDINLSADFEERVLPTPGREFLRPVYSNKILISEIYAEPLEGADFESVELYNSGADPVDLSNWQIDDFALGNAYPIPQGTVINPSQYLAFPTAGKISLNDAGDTIKLIDPNNDVKSEVLYTNALRGQSYSLFGEGYFWTPTVTPNSANILPSPNEEAKDSEAVVNIKQARTNENGENVILSGTVTAPPGILSSLYFYIQDETGGIQIYSYGREFPSLESGDLIKVSGELSSTSNERRLKIASGDDIEVIARNDPPAPKATTISKIGEELEGEYIVTSGTVSETSGDTFIIKDDKEIKVIIREATGIDKPPMRQGDRVEIAGIVSQYKDEYRILPFKQEDVKIITQAPAAQNEKHLPKAGGEELIPLYLETIAVFLWNTFQKARRRLIC